jgi:hypothetical protein
MSLKATKIGGTSVLTILGVVCLASFMIAAFTWSSQSTTSKDPQEVVLGTPSVNEWDSSHYFQAGVSYDVVMTATYNYHSTTELSYYIGIVATAGEGTIALSDFTIQISGVTATLTETTPGVWSSTAITATSPDSSDEITISIMPTTNALDLGNVYFTFSAQTTA